MMRLYFVRHGIAVNRSEPGCPPEPERPLTPEGEHKTREVARGLRSLAIKPVLFVTSPFLRALQTAQLFAEEWDIPVRKIHRSQALLPDAKPETIFHELRQMKGPNIVCFGHAPHVDRAIAYALGVRTPFTEMKKSAMACLELDAVSPPRGKLIWLAPPKLLRRLKR